MEKQRRRTEFIEREVAYRLSALLSRGHTLVRW
jgi:hypothetical protein